MTYAQKKYHWIQKQLLNGNVTLWRYRPHSAGTVALDPIPVTRVRLSADGQELIHITDTGAIPLTYGNVYGFRPNSVGADAYPSWIDKEEGNWIHQPNIFSDYELLQP